MHAGTKLYYAAGGKLYGLDCRSLLDCTRGSGSGSSCCSPHAVHIPTPAHVLLLAADTTPVPIGQQLPQGSGSRLTLLTEGGVVLSMPLPAGASSAKNGGSRRVLEQQLERRQHGGLRELEQQMQVRGET